MAEPKRFEVVCKRADDWVGQQAAMWAEKYLNSPECDAALEIQRSILAQTMPRKKED